MVIAELTETYVPEFNMNLDAPLQDILALQEPWRSATLNAWLDVYDDEHGGDILIKSINPGGVKLPFKTSKGNEFTVPPRGRRIPRRLALQLLELFGPDGQFTGMDMRTGVRKDIYEAMGEEERSLWAKHEAKVGFNFNEHYLIHVTDDSEEEDIEEND